jgi:hypothetical protein
MHSITIRRLSRQLATIIDCLVLSDRYYIDRPMKVFYWIDSKFGYAVSGGFARNALSGIANAMAAQLATTTKVEGHLYVAT